MEINIVTRVLPKRQAYLRELSDELNASPGQVRDELRQLNDAGFLESRKSDRFLNYGKVKFVGIVKSQNPETGRRMNPAEKNYSIAVIGTGYWGKNLVRNSHNHNLLRS